MGPSKTPLRESTSEQSMRVWLYIFQSSPQKIKKNTACVQKSEILAATKNQTNTM
jgi:hypothetical protein